MILSNISKAVDKFYIEIPTSVCVTVYLDSRMQMTKIIDRWVWAQAQLMLSKHTPHQGIQWGGDLH